MNFIAFSSLLWVLSLAVIDDCEVNGMATYSQPPCSDNAEVTGYHSAEVTSLAPQPTEQTKNPASSNGAVRDVSEKRQLQREITSLKGQKARLQSRRDIEITRLRQSRLQANNNLASAVLEDSLAKEIAAITAKYATDIRAVDSKIASLSKKLRRL
ncbi:hypothetical protein [Arsukibacterium sp.]|uniref:hypothetical protein n=1 Tax=Arsukibacterium sp. TaxID=1977258 RepID=UPI00299DE82D|nr:hypothetical protein [Arsukibacterium sp.]MDX1676645.1 hypothetical protein [Arsukibacterium sp.]